MIGEASGVTSLINNERLQRENQVNSESRFSDQEEEVREQNFSDVTSFTAEALALAKSVVPVGGSTAEGQLENQGHEKNQNSTARFLDIRV